MHIHEWYCTGSSAPASLQSLLEGVKDLYQRALGSEHLELQRPGSAQTQWLPYAVNAHSDSRNRVDCSAASPGITHCTQELQGQRLGKGSSMDVLPPFSKQRKTAVLDGEDELPGFALLDILEATNFKDPQVSKVAPLIPQSSTVHQASPAAHLL